MGLLRQHFETLRDLYLNELRKLSNAETQLVEALPKMAAGATTPALKQAFTDHLAETAVHVERLEAIFKDLSGAAARELFLRAAGCRISPVLSEPHRAE